MISNISYSPETFYDYYTQSKYFDKDSDTFPVLFLDAVKITENISYLKSLQNQIAENLKIYTIIGLIYDKQNSLQSLNDFSNNFLDIYFNNTNINIRKNSLFALFKIIDGEFVLISGENITSEINTNEIKQKIKINIENKNYTNAIENLLDNILDYQTLIKANNGMTRDAKILIAIFAVVVFACLIIIIVCIVLCILTEIEANTREKLLQKITNYLNSINIDNANPFRLIKDNCILCLEKIEEKNIHDINLNPVNINEGDQNKTKRNSLELAGNQIKMKENINNNLEKNPASDVRLKVKIIENQKENPSINFSNQKDFTNLAIVNDNKLNLSSNKNILNDINQNKNNDKNKENPSPEVNNKCNSLKCKHHFHKKCIEKWFKKYKICPLCRERFELEWNGVIIRKKIVNIICDHYYDYLKNYKFDVNNIEIKYTKIITLNDNSDNADINTGASTIAHNCLSRCCMWGSFYCILDFLISKIIGLFTLIIKFCKECCDR